MGKDPANFVPVKYGPGVEEMETKNKFFITLFFGSLLFMLYRSVHPKGGAKGTGAGAKKGSGGGFGGGGLGDMMNMSKSNA